MTTIHYIKIPILYKKCCTSAGMTANVQHLIFSIN